MCSIRQLVSERLLDGCQLLAAIWFHALELSVSCTTSMCGADRRRRQQRAAGSRGASESAPGPRGGLAGQRRRAARPAAAAGAAGASVKAWGAGTACCGRAVDAAVPGGRRFCGGVWHVPGVDALSGLFSMPCWPLGICRSGGSSSGRCCWQVMHLDALCAANCCMCTGWTHLPECHAVAP